MKGGEWSLAEQRTIETTLPPDIVLNRVRDYFESEEWEQPRGLPIRGPGGLKSDSVSASVIPPRGWGAVVSDT
jgi:hypothetical protein